MPSVRVGARPERVRSAAAASWHPTRDEAPAPHLGTQPARARARAPGPGRAPPKLERGPRPAQRRAARARQSRAPRPGLRSAAAGGAPRRRRAAATLRAARAGDVTGNAQPRPRAPACNRARGFLPSLSTRPGAARPLAPCPRMCGVRRAPAPPRRSAFPANTCGLLGQRRLTPHRATTRRCPRPNPQPNCLHAPHRARSPSPCKRCHFWGPPPPAPEAGAASGPAQPKN
jgi:hypothetical protein